MITLSSPQQTLKKTHKKESSTDSINSVQRKRRFLSVVSCEALITKPPIQIQHVRKISELKRQAMGQCTNRPEEPKGIQLKIKRTSANLQTDKQHEKGVGERMVLFKRRLANLSELQESVSSKENEATLEHTLNGSGLETPINRLLSDSTYAD